MQAIAASRPERILLQVTDLENAAKQIKRFRTEGYMLRKNIPLYLEPGSGKFWADLRPRTAKNAPSSAPRSAFRAKIRPIYPILCKKRVLPGQEKIKL